MLDKKIVSWMLMLGGLALFAACEGEPQAPEVIASHEPGALPLLVEREGGAGPYVESTAERFRLVASGEPFKSVRWSANAGTLVPDADQVTWTLPGAGTASLSVSVETESGKTAEGSFSFNVVAPALAASTQIDPSPEKTGAACELAFDNAGTGHVVYTNETHGTLWYASWDGTTWTTEQIDGLGANTGGNVSSSAPPALAVDPATGTPHVAYASTSDGMTYRIRYATRVNGAWIREDVDATNRASASRLGIALDPTQGQQPVIVFSDTSAGLQRATRTAANTWSKTVIYSSTMFLTGDIVFDQTGTLYLTVNHGGLRAIKGTTVESYSFYVDSTYSKWSPLVWGPNQHLLTVWNGSADASSNGFLDITVGTPLSTSTVKAAELDYENDASDLAYGGGKPYIALRRGTTLELLTTDARRLWTYTQLGTVQDGSRMSVAVRPTDGTPHVCYQRDSKVNFQ